MASGCATLYKVGTRPRLLAVRGMDSAVAGVENRENPAGVIHRSHMAATLRACELTYFCITFVIFLSQNIASLRAEI